jgi:Domain of unknown function (DUF4912)
MAEADTKRTGFRIANGPLVRQSDPEQNAVVPDFSELPRFSGGPVLFAIARDPRTIFTYWNIDWEAAFADAPPIDRQVFLRVITGGGRDESESVVEPLLGSFYARVDQPRSVYRVELGYYDQSGAWHSVAISDAVTMPPESMSEDTVVDVVTLPFHLSFQKMIDIFERSNGGDDLAVAISRLQEKDRDLMREEELEIMQAMNVSFDELASSRRAFLERAGDETSRKRAEAILGFGSTSPTHGFGGSSWS